MTFLGRENVELLVAGNQETMYKIDIEKGSIIEEVRCYLRLMLP